MKIEKALLGTRVRIRNYTKPDQSFAASLWFDPENGKYMSDPTAEYVDAGYQQALDEMQDSEDGYYFIIQSRDSDLRIGTCCAFPDASGEVYDIGYCIDKRYWRQGYGTEAVSLLLDWLQAQGAKKVTAEVAVENSGSNALLKKLGFAVERDAEFQKYHMGIVFPSHIYGCCFL